MLLPLSIQKSISIHAATLAVWDVLTNPEKIKEYLFGTEAISDWKTGSPIIFQGAYNGMQYSDKGFIVIAEPGSKLQYRYWSGFSGLEDVEENYLLVTWTIAELLNGAELTITQEGFANEQVREHTGVNWGMVLEKMKEIAERG